MKELPTELRIELEEMLDDLVKAGSTGSVFADLIVLQRRARHLQRRIENAYEAQQP